MDTHKIKPLLPSLREKKRYLVFEIISKTNIPNFLIIKSAILESCLRFLGESGVAKAGILVLPDKFNPETQKGIMRISHTMVHEVRASLALIQKIDGQDVIVRSLGLSGILKKAEKKYLG